jgi:hypothetical protein
VALLYAWSGRRLKQGVKELKGEGGVTGNGHRRRFRSKLEDDFALTKGPHRSVRRREKRVPIRLRRDGLRARFATGPKFVPGVQFHFYFVFLLFSFLFPLFLLF